MRMSRAIRQRVVQIFLVSVLTTLLLIVYVAKRQEAYYNSDEARQQCKLHVQEELRLQQLHELQRTIFLNPQRPPDARYKINVTLSEHTPLERDVPDTRPPQCQGKVYDINTLPTLSVIIPFYNEALSMLLRTVHSILRRTPDRLLKEIILVNDHSLNADLNEPLEKYVKYLPSKVILIKNPQREGLIRARMIGAGLATGEVLVIQDAHTENNVQWAEPLLEEIQKNPKTVIQPHIDELDHWTIQYTGYSDVVPRGGFSWDLRYVWMEMPAHEKTRLHYKHSYTPYCTPTLIGCALAVSKDYFLDIGGFDDGMDIWGGENIELGFRTWMCGGQILTHPCSRVAHTFKPFAYKFDGDREKIIQKNLMRIAELWMDDWKKYFLAATWTWPNKRVSLTDKDRRSVQGRKNIKERLGCKSFKWYMENIIPEIPTPPMDAHYYGEVFNTQSEACFYLTPDGYIGLTSWCFFNRLLPQNLFYIDNDGRLFYHSQNGTQHNKCLRVDRGTWLLHTGPCGDTGMEEKWEVTLFTANEGITMVTFLEEGRKRRLCLTQVTNINKQHYQEQMPQLLECEKDNAFQKWRWTYVFDFNYGWDSFNL